MERCLLLTFGVGNHSRWSSNVNQHIPVMQGRNHGVATKTSPVQLHQLLACQRGKKSVLYARTRNAFKRNVQLPTGQKISSEMFSKVEVHPAVEGRLNRTASCSLPHIPHTLNKPKVKVTNKKQKCMIRPQFQQFISSESAQNNKKQHLISFFSKVSNVPPAVVWNLALSKHRISHACHVQVC